MQTSNDHAVKVLNSLIETTLDSANGYKEAADHADSPEYKSLFAERAQRRTDLARQLQQEVRSFGGEPEDDQSLLGKLHNKFVGVKDAMSPDDGDKAIINEVERGEDVIKAKYQAAARDEDLPATVRTLVTTAYGSVKADHDQISQLKHQLN